MTVKMTIRTVKDSRVKLVNIICMLRILVYKIAVSLIEFSSYNKFVTV